MNRYFQLGVLTVLLSFCAGPVAAAAETGESLVLRQYRKALVLDPNNINIRFKIGMVLLRESRYDEAIKNLLVVRQARGDEPDINYYIGIAYAGLGSYDSAFDSYMKAKAVGAAKSKEMFELDKAFYNLGIAYQRKGLANKAVRAYEASLEIEPAQGLAWCRKGELLFEAKKYSNALDSFQRCKRGDPANKRVKANIVRTRMALAYGYMGEKKHDVALEELGTVIRLDPDNETAAYLLGYLYYLTAKYNLALAALDPLDSPKSRNIRNDLPPLLQNIGIELQQRSEWIEAERAFNHALTLKGNDPGLQYLLGLNNMKQKRYEEAVGHIKESLRLDPSNENATFALAVSTEKLVKQLSTKASRHLSEGRYSEALSGYEGVLKVDPENAAAIAGEKEARENLANLRAEAAEKRYEEIRLSISDGEKALKEQRYVDALKTFRYILAHDPSNPTALNGVDVAKRFLETKKKKCVDRGDRYAEKRMLTLALKEYRKALGYDPDDESLAAKVSAYETHLGAKIKPLLEEGEEFERQRNYVEALTLYEKALRYDPENQDALEAKARTDGIVNKSFLEHFEKGKALLADNDFPGAERHLRNAREIRPDDTDVAKALASVLYKRNNLVKVQLKAAGRAMRRKDYGKAASAYRKVEKIDPGNQEASEGLQFVLDSIRENREKKLNAADNAYGRGNYYKAHLLYGELAEADKNDKKMQKMRDRALKKHRDKISTSINSAIAAYKSGKKAEAAALFKKVLSAEPGNKTAKKYLARIKTARKKPLDRRTVERHYFRGIELYTDGKYVDAIKAWEQVLKMDPKHTKALFNIKKAKRKLEGVMDVN